MPEIRYEGREERLDKLLVSDTLTRSRAAALIHEGRVTINGKVVSQPSFKPKFGDVVAVNVPESEDTANIAEDIPITLLYEDESLAVVIKPCGMVVHPAAGNESGTLVNALLYHLDSLSGIGGEKRPGIVHRLDKDTSGLLIVAKDDQAHAALSRQLSERQMEKHYLALAAGQMKGTEGSIDLAIGRSLKDRKKMAPRPDGRCALTHWTVLQQRSDRALLDVRLVTGRTHQIRVHMAAIGHPVLGDPLYAARGTPKAGRLMLHAWRLKFTHPKSGEELRFEAPPEESFGYIAAGEPWR
ncbi:MAG: RluA family pseudouridine synthase [Eubacteriales bacterium]